MAELINYLLLLYLLKRDGQCELSDIEQRDLRPGYDYLQDKSFWMYTWDFGSAGCYRPPPPGQPPTISDHPPWGMIFIYSINL